jgi:hypothetical protein
MSYATTAAPNRAMMPGKIDVSCQCPIGLGLVESHCMNLSSHEGQLSR